MCSAFTRSFRIYTQLTTVCNRIKQTLNYREASHLNLDAEKLIILTPRVLSSGVLGSK